MVEGVEVEAMHVQAGVMAILVLGGSVRAPPLLPGAEEEKESVAGEIGAMRAKWASSRPHLHRPVHMLRRYTTLGGQGVGRHRDSRY